MNDREQLEQAIAAQEKLRGIVDDAIIDAVIATLRQEMTSLNDTAHILRQKKLITVLFTDIAGSTRLVRGLDPEDINMLLDTALKRLSGAITRHEGTVTRYMGDGFKAVFGLRQTLEDDADRAVRAGLDLIAISKSVAEEIEARWGRKGFNIRVGINTGWVVTGGFSEGEDTIMGLTVNLAARMESAAPVGGVLISSETLRYIEDRYEFTEVEPVNAKGFDHPVRAYHVMREKPRDFHRKISLFENIETRFVGRSHEMTLLQETWQQVLEYRELGMVTLLGEPGIGKTRLMYEFENWIKSQQEEVQIFKGRALKEFQRIPYSLIRDLFIQRFHIGEFNVREIARERIESGLWEEFGGDETGRMRAQFVAELFGFDFSNSPHMQAVTEDPRQISDRGRNYLGEYFKKLASHTPILFILEDLQWADESSLGVLKHLENSRLSNEPVLVVSAAREELLERWPDWEQSPEFASRPKKISHRLIELDCLPDDESHQLVGHILQKVRDLPPELSALIVRQTEGNPYYIEEMIKVLIGDGIIVKGENEWEVTRTRLETLRIPPTLEEIILSRLDSLPPQERRILQQASAIGRIFWDLPLYAFNEKFEERIPPGRVGMYLQTLCEREMILSREQSVIPRAREHMFAHAVMRDVTYESVLRTARHLYHRMFAEWLIENVKEKDDQILGMIVEHFEWAEASEEARQYLRKAGARAARKYANAEAVEYYGKALTLAPEGDVIFRLEMLLARNRLFDTMGKRAEQEEEFPIMDQLASQLGEETADGIRFRAEVALRKSKFYEITGNFPEAEKAASQSVELAQQVGNAEIEAAGRIRWIVALWRQGFYEDARELAQQTLKLTQRAGLTLLEAHAKLQVANIDWFQGRYQDARARYEEALETYRQINYGLGIASALYNLALVDDALGEIHSSETFAVQAAEVYNQIGNKMGILTVKILLSASAEARGDYESRISLVHEAMEMACQTGNLNQEAMGLQHLGNAYSKLGDYKTAQVHLENGLATAEKVGNKRTQAFILIRLAWNGIVLKDLPAARQRLQRASGLVDLIDLNTARAEYLTTMGLHHLALGETEAGRVDLQAALAIFQELEEPKSICQVKAHLAQAALALGEADRAAAYAHEILDALPDPAACAGLEDPFLVFTNCFHALQTSGDPRLEEAIRLGCALLEERLNIIQSPALRASFIENVPWNREMAGWCGIST